MGTREIVSAVPAMGTIERNEGGDAERGDTEAMLCSAVLVMVVIDSRDGGAAK